MRCGTRALSLTSLGFGLVATGALSLAVATDYWLFTVEPVPATMPSNDTAMMMAAAAAAAAEEELETDVSEPPPGAVQDGPDVSSVIPIIPIRIHSGLWRLCMINDLPGGCIFL